MSDADLFLEKSTIDWLYDWFLSEKYCWLVADEPNAESNLCSRLPIFYAGFREKARKSLGDPAAEVALPPSAGIIVAHGT
jgi:hypothetical protein